jgi:hypothetical protein
MSIGYWFSKLLPIIYNIRKANITDSYHKFLGLTRSGDTMALSLVPVFQSETSFPQLLADVDTERTGTIVTSTIRH